MVVSKAGSSSIKGGGRVELTSDLEDAIVDLLKSRRNPQHPLLPISEENNDDSTSRRRFLKRLIESHERHTLSVQLNQVSLIDEKDATSKRASSAKAPSKSTGGKVRFDVVEAVYKSPDKWKPGSSKKTIVLDRSTPIAAILKQAKDKIKMKKKALRCFYVERKIELELTNNLEGLEDGAVVYVTSQAAAKKEDAKEDEAGDDVVLPDPLDVVKRVYAQRARRQRERVTLEPPQPFGEQDLPDLPDFRAQLPAAKFRKEILQALDQSRILILCGATGCGKSTQVPQYIWECMPSASTTTNIVVTQPRRVAAMALAARVAVEQGSTPPGRPGSLVGYQVRLDAAVTDTTRITYMTVGILLRRLTTPSSSDQVPLADISHLIVDEVHERDINTDFCLTILRRVLVRNSHLKIILMSATNTPDLFYNYFRSDKLGIQPTILQVPGRTFPVDVFWLNDIEKMIGRKLNHWTEDDSRHGSKPSHDKLSPRAAAVIDNAFISRLVFHLVNSEEHASTNPAILVFLPGRGEIEWLARTLRYDDKDTGRLSIQILHSSVSQADQKAVFQPVEKGKFKCVLATNVAETSITIPSVSIVIDTGRVKESRFNSAARIKELVTVWTSRSSATQRTGRAGRTRQGYCYRLYPEKFAENQMLERTTPEILRTPLDDLVLQSCLLDEDRKDRQKKEKTSLGVPEGTLPVDFLSRTPDPPPTESLVGACRHLIEVGALQFLKGDDAYIQVKLTPLGYHLSQLPMDAKIGKILIVGSILGCVEPALTAAAALSSTRSIFFNSSRDSHKDIVENGFGGATWEGGTSKGDTIASIAAYEEWTKRSNYSQRLDYAKEHGLNHIVLVDVFNLRQRFRTCMLDAGFVSSRRDKGAYSENALLTSCCLVAGLYPNVATLMRPVRGKLGFRGGRLLSQDGSVCTPSLQSLQVGRVRNVSETGRDAYAVYQSKNQIVGAAKAGASGAQQQKIFLTEVNFVSKFALLLFGGNLQVKDNFIVVDDWLKFKVGDKGRRTAILMTELRRELDMLFLNQLSGSDSSSSRTDDPIIEMVVRLLQDE